MRKKAIALTPALERILREAIYPFHFVTRSQVTRLLYKPGSYKGVGDHLLLLERSGYLERFALPTPFGFRPYIYMLGERGKAYFRDDLGWEIPKLPNLSTMQTRSQSFLMHHLEVNNAIIAAKLLERSMTGVRQVRFEHDITLKHQPLVTTSASGKKVSVAPDAILDIEASERRVLWIEVERGTNSDQYVLAKMQDIYDVFDRRVFQQRVGTNRCRVCYLTTAGESDVRRLLGLAERVLSTRLGSDAPQSIRCQIYNIRRMVAMGTGDIDGVDIYMGAGWQQPYRDAMARVVGAG